MSVVWATTYLDEAERCDEVLVLNEGRVLARVRPEISTPVLGGGLRAGRLPRGPARRQPAGRDLPGVVDAIIKGSASG